MKALQIKSLILTLCLLFSMSVLADDRVPAPPVPPRLVVDYTETLTQSEVQYLENKLVMFNDTTSTQILVVLVPSFDGLTKEDYADRLAQKWGVGQKDKNNGIVVLVKQKTSSEKGEIRISVGYGLEGAVPDAIARRIVDQEMLPAFRNDNYFEGIDQATSVLMSLTAGEYSAEAYADSNNKGAVAVFLPFIIFIIIFILIRVNQARHYSTGSSSLPFWTALWLGSSLGSGSNSGSWSNFNSGSSGFGGGSSFGGFGGGSFGGGGAGGSW